LRRQTGELNRPVLGGLTDYANTAKNSAGNGKRPFPHSLDGIRGRALQQPRPMRLGVTTTLLLEYLAVQGPIAADAYEVILAIAIINALPRLSAEARRWVNLLRSRKI
jgi:hypothetical protein